jgi:hypothetical protein
MIAALVYVAAQPILTVARLRAQLPGAGERLGRLIARDDEAFMEWTVGLRSQQPSMQPRALHVRRDGDAGNRITSGSPNHRPAFACTVAVPSATDTV